jgi:hypothetical protein
MTFFGLLSGDGGLWTHLGLWPHAISGLLLAGLPGVMIYRDRNCEDGDERRDTLLLCLGPVLFLLTGNVVHSHYFTLAVPLIVVLLRLLDDEGFGKSTVPLMAFLLGLAYLMINGLFFQTFFPLRIVHETTLWHYFGALLLYLIALLRLAARG